MAPQVPGLLTGVEDESLKGLVIRREVPGRPSLGSETRERRLQPENCKEKQKKSFIGCRYAFCLVASLCFDCSPSMCLRHEAVQPPGAVLPKKKNQVAAAEHKK